MKQTNHFKNFKTLSIRLLASVTIAAAVSCTGITSPNSAPADHTVNKSGVMHKTGLTDPLNNCTSCHGSDLKGGSAGVSCTSCHGVKW